MMYFCQDFQFSPNPSRKIPRKNESGSAQVIPIGAPEALPGHSRALGIKFENQWKESSSCLLNYNLSREKAKSAVLLRLFSP